MNANETVVVASRPRPIHFIAHTRNIRAVSVTVRTINRHRAQIP